MGEMCWKNKAVKKKKNIKGKASMLEPEVAGEIILEELASA